MSGAFRKRIQSVRIVLICIMLPWLIGLAPASEAQNSVTPLLDLRHLPAMLPIHNREPNTNPSLTDLDDPSNPINKYATYGLIGSGSAVDYGLTLAYPNIPGAADAYKFCPHCFDPHGRFSGIGKNGISATQIADVLHQADQAANYGLNLLNAINGGTWNQFLGVAPFPNSWSSPIDPNLAFLGSSNFGNIGLNSSGFSQFHTYTPSFFNSVAGFTTSPWFNAPFIPTNPIYPSCSIGNIFQPTTITFTHIGSRPIAVSLLNNLCEEVLFTYVFPGTSYQQLTFVGQTWTFRDAFTNVPVAFQPTYTVLNQQPHFFTFFDLPGQVGISSARLSSVAEVPAAVIQASDTYSLEFLKARRESILETQLDAYYASTALSRLRAEANAYLLKVLYSDPDYLYWGAELSRTTDSIQSALPSYKSFALLQREIEGWDSTPASSTELQQRYDKRQELARLQEQLDLEESLYLAAHPDIDEQLRTLSAWLANRIEVLYHREDVILWFAGWKQRWAQAYAASSDLKAVSTELERLVDDYPAFGEYLQLNGEVSRLLPSLASVPAFQPALSANTSASNNRELQQEVASLRADYTQQTNSILRSTDAPIAIERYYSHIASLLRRDSRYQAFTSRAAIAQNNLARMQQETASAMAACYAQNGAACDPASDKRVQAALGGADIDATTMQLGEAYEQQDSFWHGFYTGTDYRAIESETRNRLRTPLATIQSQLTSARTRLDAAISAKPQLRTVNELSSEALRQLCQPVAGLTAGSVSDPGKQLCTRLERMEELAAQLGDMKSFNFQTPGLVYLPLALR